MASGNGVTQALRSPQSVLPHCGSTFRCASASALSSRNPPLDTAFHSPAARTDLSIRLRGWVDAPGLHLRERFRNLRVARSVPRSRPRAGLFLPRRGAIHARHPLPRPISEFPICHQASAPLQDLSIPRAHSAQPDSKHGSLPLRVARFSFAPRCARNNHLFNSATDHRSGSATSRQLDSGNKLIGLTPFGYAELAPGQLPFEHST
jgi:hypothetical protein